MKKYAERDITSEELMGPYMEHVNAMTEEGLHSKSDIAAELAYRDALIRRVRENVKDGFKAHEDFTAWEKEMQAWLKEVENV